MVDAFINAFFTVIVIALLSFAVLSIPFLAAARLSRRSARPRLLKAFLAGSMLLSVFQSTMHFRMQARLAPIRDEFRSASHMDSDSYVRTDMDIIDRRDALLRDEGYVGIGRWWASWGGWRPRVDTTMIYLYLPL